MSEAEYKPKEKPKAHTSLAAKELDNAEKQFDDFDKQVKAVTMDRMAEAPKLETESSIKLSQKQIEESADVYLKPHKVISPGGKDKFNEKFRDEYNFSKEYVKFIAENKEVQGETIDIWTRPFPGMPAEEWLVPVGKPVWGPRYLAEQIKRKSYHRLAMEEKTITGHNQFGQTYGKIVVDNTIERLTAIPVSNRKSIFMGSGGF